MNAKNDLYKILQVHPSAEPEVIDAAYRKLAKKYHPDKNRNVDTNKKMKLINMAYAVLRDSHKRMLYNQEYNRTINKGNNYASETINENVLMQAKETLAQYFGYLIAGELEDAYGLITEEDKKHISKKDFIKWQTLVGSLYEILEYTINYSHTITGVKVGDMLFTEVYEFNVSIIEKKKTNSNRENTDFLRKVVLAKNSFRIYLGYKEVKSFIAKLQEILQETDGIDKPEFERSRLVEQIGYELARSARYDRPFSLLLLEAVNYYSLYEGYGKAHTEKDFTNVLQLIQKNIRTTDYYGRWSSNRILLLLPETKVLGAQQVAVKLMRLMQKRHMACYGKKKLVFCGGIVQNNVYSLQEMLDIAVVNLLGARENGEWFFV